MEHIATQFIAVENSVVKIGAMEECPVEYAVLPGTAIQFSAFHGSTLPDNLIGLDTPGVQWFCCPIEIPGILDHQDEGRIFDFAIRLCHGDPADEILILEFRGSGSFDHFGVQHGMIFVP